MNAIVLCVAAAGLASGAMGQVLNGGFENNTASGTQFNLSNVGYNSLVANSTAFGAAEEIDLVTTTGFGAITPQTGAWMVGLHRNIVGDADALSLTLGTPVVMGQQYYLNFASAQYSAANAGTLEIGLSGSATSLGTYLLSATPGSDTTWTLYGYTFIAPVNASYLTLTVSGVDGYVFADSIGLTLVPTPGAAAAFGLAGAAMLRRRR